MLSNEKEFDDKLKEIGSLYEEGKDCLNRIDLWGDQDHKRLYEILERLRTLAATQLVGTHKVNDN